MDRSVSCRFDAELDGVSDVILSFAVADAAHLASESIAVTLGGSPIEVDELAEEHGTRLHTASSVGPGRIEVTYTASISGRAEPPPVTPIDLIRYTRPSRYCESDRLAPFARAEFGSLKGLDLVEAVSSWVGTRIVYISGSSRPTDGAVATLLAGQGVCRDFAHLVVAILRGCDLPARLASVYAPGLQPMDFHAVAEAYVDGAWLVVDATCLAPRSAMIRIATGRDAADTAFLTTTGDRVDMGWLEVMAITEGALPGDDMDVPVHLG